MARIRRRRRRGTAVVAAVALCALAAAPAAHAGIGDFLLEKVLAEPGAEQGPEDERYHSDAYKNEGTKFLDVSPGRQYAGEKATVIGDHWFAPTTCKNKVSLRLVDSAGKSHNLGRTTPGYNVTVVWGQSFVPSTVRINGTILKGITIPEKAAPGPARLIGKQKLRLKLPPFVPDCDIHLQTKTKRTSLTILRPRLDSVITAAGVEGRANQGEPIRLLWKLSRPGMVRVRLAYLATDATPMLVRTLLDARRGEGNQELDFRAVLNGHPLPPGKYAIRIEHQDDPAATRRRSRTGIRPARPKTVKFTLGLGR